MPQIDAQIRTDAIAERLDRIRDRVAQACDRAGRDPSEITIVAVSKTFPLDAIEAATQVGLRQFGENRARELRDKARERPGTINGGDIEWRFMGHLQRNKAKFIARHADAFDALDSPRLAKELDKRAAKNDRVIPCLVQVNITEQDRKYGFLPDEVHDFLDQCAQYEHLSIRGLMAMAKFIDEPSDRDIVRQQFRRMRELFDTYNARSTPGVAMDTLSTGMTNDLEIAIEEGSTMIRPGSGIFGPRDYD
jgi:hypothetical protein